MVNKNREVKRILFLGVILAFSFRMVYGQKRPEPKLIWQWSVKEKERIAEFIDEVSITYDGGLILVNVEEINAGKKERRYLIDGKSGKVIKSFQETRPSDYWVLSPDGKEMIDDYGRVADTKNKTLRVNNLNLLRNEGQYPLFSPSKRYVALLGNTMISGEIFIEMYDLGTGRLLWEYMPEEPKGGFAAKFINDQRIVVYEYDKVRMLDVKTGEKFWEVEVFKNFGEERALFSYLHMVVNDSGDICISVFDGGLVTFVSRDGQIRWEKLLGPAPVGGMALSPSGKFLSVMKEASVPGDPIELYLIDNLTGEEVWKRKMSIGGAAIEDGTAYFVSDKYLFRCNERIKEETVMGRYLYLWNVETGELLWKWIPGEGGRVETIQLSGDKKRLLARNRKNIYLFDISHLEGSKK